MIYLTIRPKQNDLLDIKEELARKRTAFHNLKIAVYGLFTGCILGLTPAVMQYADAQRAIPGIGAEIFFPVIPIVLYPVFDMFCTAIWGKVVKKWLKKNGLKVKLKNS